MSHIYRGVARGGAGGASAPRNLAHQLTLLEPGWADFAPHTTVSPPGFKKLSTPLHMKFTSFDKMAAQSEKFITII